MTAGDVETAARLFDDFIKLEWQDIFRKEVHVKLDNGARYVPNSGSQGVQLLRKNVNAFDEAIRIWSGPTADPDSGTQGYDRIVDQHRSALARAQARAEAAQRAAEEEDDRVIAVMNTKRHAEGKQPLTDQQEASVRERRRSRPASS